LGVQYVCIDSKFFPFTLRGQVGDWYRFITPNPNLVGKEFFTKFIFEFPSLPILQHYESFPEIFPTPQCDFFNVPHVQ